MFTGIIESLGRVLSITPDGSNLDFHIESPISHELKVDQSLSHNGVCLTVTHVANTGHSVTAILETLQKSNLGSLQPGDLLNLERCMPATGRFDGHIVQGHVDCTATCISRIDENGSQVFRFEHDPGAGVTVEKGSVCVNGISLTVIDSVEGAFSVAIIPFTMEHTNLGGVQPGHNVNLEFDILGKYIQKYLKR